MLSWWAYQNGQYIEWQTAPVPAGYTAGKVSFIFTLSWYNSQRTDVYLEGQRILTDISLTGTTDQQFVQGNVELFCDYKGYYSGSNGVCYLTVPAGRVTAGASNTLKATEIQPRRGNEGQQRQAGAVLRGLLPLFQTHWQEPKAIRLRALVFY